MEALLPEVALEGGSQWFTAGYSRNGIKSLAARVRV